MASLEGAHLCIYRVSIFGVSIFEAPLPTTPKSALAGDNGQCLFGPPYRRPRQPCRLRLRLNFLRRNGAIRKQVLEPLPCLTSFVLVLPSDIAKHIIGIHGHGALFPFQIRGAYRSRYAVGQAMPFLHEIPLCHDHEVPVFIFWIGGKRPRCTRGCYERNRVDGTVNG